MRKDLYFSDIEIIEQRIREIHFSDSFNRDVDFDFLNQEDFSTEIEYDVFTNKEDETDHLIIFSFNIEEKVLDEENPIRLEFILQGHYKIANSVLLENYSSIQHFGSLALMINFLRLSFFNVTTLIKGKGLSLPLIDLEFLHKNYKERKAKEKKETKNLTKKNKKAT